MKVYLVRHGQSIGNATDRGESFSQDDSTNGLTDLGWKQARNLGQRLQNEDVTHIVTSKLLRAQQTAQAINETLNVPVETLDFAHEYEQSDEYHENGRDPKLSQFFWMPRHPADYAPPGAESFTNFMSRVDQLLAYLESHLESDRNILVVGHGTFFRFLLGRILWRDELQPAEVNKISRIETTNTGISIIEYSSDQEWLSGQDRGWVIKTWMDHAHL